VLTASKISLSLVLIVCLPGCLNHSRFASLESDSPSVVSSKTTTLKTTPLSVANPEFYLVKPGDTLYSIAFRFGLDYRKLATANQISHSYRIYEGQSLILKEVEIDHKTNNKLANNKPKSNTSKPADSVTKVNSQKNGAQVSAKTSAKIPIGSWKCPHNGKIVRTYASGSSSQKGIDIIGRIGDSVLAATNGVVVYAGNGLPGYGNLIIIEHSNSLLSAYAFTQKILVKEKEQSKTGQKIATMGKQCDQPGLHFEIRQNGKPVDPMKFLPGQ